MWAGVVAAILIAVLVYNRVQKLLFYAMARWLRFNSELTDKTIGLSLDAKLAAYDGKPNIMLGSSTMAFMPALNDDYCNLGVPSLCTHHLIRSLPLLRQVRAKRVVFYAGINDTILNIPPQTIADNISEIMDALEREDSIPNILYIPLIESPYQRYLGARRLAYIRAINVAVGDALREFDNVTIIRPTFVDRMFGMDKLHLNKRGNAHMRAEILAALKS